MTAAGASPDTATIAFSVSDGVALSTALAQHVAREHGIRMLVIKGPISAELGLRTRRYSTDVDIVVEPARTKDLIEALGAYGWTPRPWPDFPKLPEQHRIASFLSSIETLLTDENQSLELLKAHKKGLMQQIFPSLESISA